MPDGSNKWGTESACRTIQENGRCIAVFPADSEGEAAARKTAALSGLPFFPKAEIFGNKLLYSVYGGLRTASVSLSSAVIISSLLPPQPGWICVSPDPDGEGTASVPVPSFVKEKTGINPLFTSKTVFIGGRGLGSRENYLRLKKLAGRFGAACGCTRPVAMNGWEDYDNFIGISGISLCSDTVVTFGVSGAGPLIGGIEKAKKIIAVNSDPHALIFSYFDVGIVEDCMSVISAMEKL